MLTIIALHLHTIVAHHTSNLTNQVVIRAGLADRIAVHTGVERSQMGTKILLTQRHLIFAKEAQFQFSCRHWLIAKRAGTLNLLLEKETGRNADRLALLGPQIANAGGDAVFPGYKCEG